MRPAYRLVVYIIAITLFLNITSLNTEAQSKKDSSMKLLARAKMAGEPVSKDISSVAKARRSASRLKKDEIDALLYDAIRDRIGLPYRSAGTDNRGYDCSGFVWRVFQEAGVRFDRGSARTLWSKLPKANESEEEEFGTLVFFRGLNHVGIVRDAYSFYHVSSSQGVVRSFYTGYWKDRVTGFRRVPLAVKKSRPK